MIDKAGKMIAIKGMTMPKNCDECDFIQRGYPDWCDLRVSCYDIYNSRIRQSWCPLIEVAEPKQGEEMPER